VRTIKAAGLGTLFTVKGAKLSNAAHIDEMQTLAWLAKANRAAGARKVGFVNHPWHPSKEEQYLSTPDDAYAYAASIFASPEVWPHVLADLGLEGKAIALVPMPASCTTKSSAPGERWPALALAKALASHGLGNVYPCVVNRSVTQEQTASKVRIQAHAIADNHEVLVRPPLGHAFLLVDDVITWGKRTAAVDHSLGGRRDTGAICIAFTDDNTQTEDAYRPKLRTITYSADARPWTVSISPVM